MNNKIADYKSYRELDELEDALQMAELDVETVVKKGKGLIREFGPLALKFSEMLRFVNQAWDKIGELKELTRIQMGISGRTPAMASTRYDRIASRIVKAQNETFDLDEQTMKVAKFFKDNPNPKDADFHKWAEGKGYDVHGAESSAYKLATICSEFLLDGRANEKHLKAKDVDKDELAMGIKVEMEHTTDKKTAERISLDHLAEIEDYYTRLKKMEDDAGAKDANKVEAAMKVAYGYHKSYGGDPYWLTLRYSAHCSKCHIPLEKGERAFYYPRGKQMFGEKCGHGQEAEADFHSNIEMEEGHLI